MDRKILALLLLSVGVAVTGCQSSGLKQSFQAQLPVEGMITFTD